MTSNDSPRRSVSSRLAMLPPVRDLSESRVLVSMVFGCVVTALFYLIVINLLFPGTYLSAAFSERGIIPYLTSFLCGTGLFLLMFGSLRVLREENAFEFIRTVISQHSPLDRDGSMQALRGVRKSRESHGGIVANRFVRALHAVGEGVRSKSELGDTLRGMGDIDHSILEAAHMPIKFGPLTWLSFITRTGVSRSKSVGYPRMKAFRQWFVWMTCCNATLPLSVQPAQASQLRSPCWCAKLSNHALICGY